MVGFVLPHCSGICSQGTLSPRQETPSSSVMLRKGFQMKLIFELKSLNLERTWGD